MKRIVSIIIVAVALGVDSFHERNAKAGGYDHGKATGSCSISPSPVAVGQPYTVSVLGLSLDTPARTERRQMSRGKTGAQPAGSTKVQHAAGRPSSGKEPCWLAQFVAKWISSAAFCSPSLNLMFSRWVSMVLKLILRQVAISRVLSPAPNN